MPEGRVLFLRDFGCAVDEARQFGIGFRPASPTDQNRDDHADQERPQSAEHVRGHWACLAREREITQSCGIEPTPDKHAGRRGGADEQAPEAAARRGPLPEHAEDDCTKQRRDKDAEERLNVIHDAQELHGKVGRADANQHASDGA